MMSESTARWQCPKCNASNQAGASVCASCMASLVGAGQEALARQRLDRARAFEAEGRFDQAIVQLLEASKDKPGDWEISLRLGIVYEKKGSRPEAAAAFEDAVRSRPQDPEAHFRLGAIYRALDRLEEALAQFTMALQHDPQHAGARTQAAALESVRREVVRKPPERPRPDEAPVIIKPRPIVSADSARAGAAAAAVGIAASALAAYLFVLLVSQQLVGVRFIFIQFSALAMIVVWLLSGVACASVAAPLLPVGGAAAGLLVGIAAPLLFSHITGIPLGAAFVARAAGAGTILTCGIEFLTRGTFLGEKRQLIFWGAVAAICVSSLYRLGSGGLLRGQVVRHVRETNREYVESVPDADIYLISSADGLTYHTTSGTDHAGYRFNAVPAGNYRLIYRDPATGYLQEHQVKVEFAITSGTRRDLWVSGRLK